MRYDHSTHAPLWVIMLPLLVFVAVWQLVASVAPSSQFFFSSPLRIVGALWQVTVSGEVIVHVGVTIFEAFAGFLIGTVCGTALGLSLWYWPSAASISRPYVTAISAVPPFALAPLVIVWFGVGVFAKIMVAALATVFVAVVQAYEGARNVDERHLRLVRILGGNRSDEFRKIVVPTAIQWVVNSMRLNVGFALTGAFIGEFISAERGLGYFIVRSAALYDMSRVLAGCILLMIVALSLNAMVDLLESRLLGRRKSL